MANSEAGIDHEVHTVSVDPSAGVFLSACPLALLLCSNAIDPARQNTRTGNILDGLRRFNVYDLPIYGIHIHDSSSSCGHDAEEVKRCKHLMTPFKQLIATKNKQGMLLVLGRQAEKVLVEGEDSIVPDATCIPYPSEWNKNETARKIAYAAISFRIEKFMSYEDFESLLHCSHVTSAMMIASSETMSWVKHLPNSDAQKAAASITGTRTIELIKHLPSSAAQKAAASITGTRTIELIKHLPSSAAQKAAASITGTRTIELIKHLPATTNTKRAAAENGRSENSRKASKITGDTIGQFHLAAAKLKPGFRDQWRADVEQLTPQILADAVAELAPLDKDLLFLAHRLCKQRGHLLNKLKLAVRVGVLSQDDLDTLTRTDAQKASRRNDVETATALRLYDMGLTLWQTAWMNPRPVSGDDVRSALNYTENVRRLHEKTHPRLKRGRPPQEVIDIIKDLPHVSAWRAALAFAVPGAPAKELVSVFA
jgi:hypothetical protein